jgi:hypothetical protein
MRATMATSAPANSVVVIVKPTRSASGPWINDPTGYTTPSATK